jgi:hypothetical protein
MARLIDPTSWRYGLSTWLLQLFQEVGLKHRYITAIAYALSGQL